MIINSSFFINSIYILLIISLMFLSGIIYFLYFFNNNSNSNALENESHNQEFDEEDENKKEDVNDKDFKLLKSIDDSKDPNLRNFKLRLVEVKRSFGNYWNNYYNWHYKYNGNYKLFNWYRFNKWSWSKKDYDALKAKSDSDFEHLKISWLKFQESYLKISRNSPYHDLVTRIYLHHFDLLQLIKKSIINSFSSKK